MDLETKKNTEPSWLKKKDLLNEKESYFRGKFIEIKGNG